jgi:hypothetical protein
VGDTVLVAPGTYVENLNFLGKDIVVKSEAGPDVTTLDGSGTKGSVVLFRSGEGAGAVLEGFRITGGVGELLGEADFTRSGGGISIGDSSPTIRNNVIENNSAGSYGGGIVAAGTGPGPRLQGNVIRNNTCLSSGGGIAWSSSGLIDGNLVEKNTAIRGDGGGIWILNSVPPIDLEISNNRIKSNRAGDHGGGVIAVCAISDELNIHHNLVAGNEAGGSSGGDFSGGGFWVSGGTCWIHHNTVVGNAGRGGDASYGGGGFALRAPGVYYFDHNLVAFATYGGGMNCEDGVNIVFQDNLGWDNIEGDGNGGCADWTSVNGGVVADPLLCDRQQGNYHVAEDSPALTQLGGPIGAYPDPGCPPVPVERITWGQLKARYR